jgi:hypothetical protein
MINKIDAHKGWRLVVPVTALLLGALFLAGVAFAQPQPSGTLAANGRSPLVPVATPPGCVPGWRIVDSPNPNSTYNALYKVDAVSSTDVWAVGLAGLGPLIEHWDGSTWSAIPSPAGPYTTGTLLDVAALSADDVWAVGFYDPPSPDPDNDVVAILHWNGIAWSVIPGPDVLQSYGSRLSGVDAISANDVWAVGWTGTNDFNYRALTLHWDGATWSVVPNPLTANSALHAVAAIASNDVWAVGGAQGSLLLHWDGSSWSVAPTSSSIPMYDVSAAASNDVWAVGYISSGGGGSTSAILHWNGTAWSQSLSNTGEYFTSVTAISASDAWVVGGNDRVLHWDGAQWLFAYPPRPYPYGGDLLGVAAASPGEVWAVGRQSTSLPGDQTLTVRYTAACPVITPTPTGCDTGWTALDSPNGDANANSLRGVTVVSSNDVWAVGTSGPGDYRPLSMHWDGYAWSILPMPNPQGGGALYAVSAAASDDVWAVGWTSNWTKPLTMHWDGAQWSIVPSPNSASGGLRGVVAISSNDVWAVGGTSASPFAMHWNGAAWTIVPTPPGAIPNAVSAVSTDDVWAVGRGQSGSLTMHWNGNVWSVVPNPGPAGASLSGVKAIASDDVWAVGYNSNVLLTLHWDGTSWTTVPTPDGVLGALYAVSASAPDDVWAVGEQGANPAIVTLALHWDGTKWQAISSANVDQHYNTLYGVAVVSRNEAWSVGDQGSFSTTGQFTLIERYIASCATPTPTPVATFTPTNSPAATSTSVPTLTSVSTATYTPMPSSTSSPESTATAIPTGTHTASTATVTPTSTVAATASPTICPMSFTDVPSGSTFHTFIRCLTCRGIISGYADGTFRPNNNVTRGQLSKLVSNAAGFNEAISGQTFQDVPPGSDFYLFVERMSRRGIIGGYPCGGAGGQCGAGNRPYFRLNAGATRGQIAKIVSNAKGYTDTPSGQTFQDLSTSSTFYPFVERLTTRGIMGGYPCGGAGEPCGTSNKPYFRPNTNATRGQISKIVTNTFFPECQGANR